jgi:hypothetical protein
MMGVSPLWAPANISDEKAVVFATFRGKGLAFPGGPQMLAPFVDWRFARRPAYKLACQSYLRCAIQRTTLSISSDKATVFPGLPGCERLSAESLAWVNDMLPQGILRIGQKLKLPTQAWLDANKARHEQAMRAAFYVAMGGELPIPSSAADKGPQVDLMKLPSIEEQITSNLKTFPGNGYLFVANDLLLRGHRAMGELQFGTAAERSQSVQAAAGGDDRRETDQGGHFIAVRFNGPAEWYNHFAQDANFNNSAFRKLENEWDRKGTAGHEVIVDISAHYRGLSRRPYELEVRWEIDGQPSVKTFPNEAGVK